MKTLIAALVEAKEWLSYATLKELGREYVKSLHPNANEIEPLNKLKELTFTVVNGNSEKELFLAQSLGKEWGLEPAFYNAVKKSLPPHNVEQYRDMMVVSAIEKPKIDWPVSMFKPLAMEYVKSLHKEADEIGVGKDKNRLVFWVYKNGEDTEIDLGEKNGDFWFLDKGFYQAIKTKLPPHDPLDYKGVIQVEPLEN